MGYNIFISYRRKGTGFGVAGELQQRFEKLGYEVFLDVDEIHAGEFPRQIEDAIKESEDFILILSPGALDRCKNPKDWVRKEISLAEKCGKNIICLSLPDYEMPNQEELPKNLKNLPQHQTFIWSHELRQASFDKLVVNLRSKIAQSQNTLTLKIRCDADCIIKKEDEEIGRIKANVFYPIKLCKGSHFLSFESVENANDKVEELYEVQDPEGQKILLVKLADVIKTRQEKERKAEEAEKKRLAEIEAEKIRIAEEAERKRLAAIEAERKRLIEEENERKRLAAIEAERERVKKDMEEKRQKQDRNTKVIGSLYTFDDGSKGIIFYSKDGHGLVVSLDEAIKKWEDVSSYTDCHNISNIPDEDDYNTNLKVGLGATYTTYIINQLDKGQAPAAEWCRSKGSEWYLPSASELWQLLCVANGKNGSSGAISTALKNNGGTALNGWYWSSSEYDYNNAWGLKIVGNAYFYTKNANYGTVRAVRAF